MCGRYVTVTKTEIIEKKFHVKAVPDFDFNGDCNIAAGDKAPIITSEEPGLLQSYVFGFTPSWSEKKTFIINARAEGDHNKDNSPMYSGAKGIISKPFFRASIRNKRCLVIADAFIEGTTSEKLKKPFLVYLLNKQRPFAMAGIYDTWIDKLTGEVINSFAIITTRPNTLMQKIPHHRMPVILDDDACQMYLKTDAQLSEITNLLEPFSADKMNAYPISPAISKKTNKDVALLEPKGERVQPEYLFKHSEEIKLEGMGMTTSRKKKNS
ncbi:MAG: SOS response-associated peptidase [Crocinitomicaceae bacterium]|nr:SOS response-associated peptidase [Crocinitomicaceae bacterium]MBK8926236.1 SOS response-associated peptidase [Crocinitomicaceae bacterium]